MRIAGPVEFDSIERLLHDFNRESNKRTPSASTLADRFRLLLEGGDTLVLLAGEGPDGVVVLRLRMSAWSDGYECYLAELSSSSKRTGRPRVSP